MTVQQCGYRACGVFQLYDNVLRWWFLCALHRACIAPTRDIACRFRGRDRYAGCHRYDQSALNILIVNYFNDNRMAYVTSVERRLLLSVESGSHGKEEVLVCHKNQSVYRTKSANYF